MKIYRFCWYNILFVLVFFMLVGCDQAEPKDKQSPPLVSVMIVTASRLELSEDLPGRVAAVRIAEIRPQVSGIVQRRLFEQGSEVQAGQPLFQINPAPFKADADTAAAAMQRADVALARAQVQARRLQSLVEADAVSRQVYDDSVSLRDQAAADVAQARATLERRKLDLKFATVEAPISGRIDQALVTEGALVGSGDSNPMARIHQIDQVYVDVRRPASSLESLRQALTESLASVSDGLPVVILRSNGDAYDVTGRILFSGVNVDVGTGDVLLRVLVDNPQRLLLPGMFVRARVPRFSYAEALTVPQQAVVRKEGQPHVWILDAQNRVQLIPVVVDELVNGHYRVQAGLIAGQAVVVEGTTRLYSGAEVKANEWHVPKPIPVSTAR